MAYPKCKYCKKEIKDKSSAYLYQKTESSPKLYFCDESEFNMYMAEEDRVKIEKKKRYKPTKTKVDGTPNPRRLLTDEIQRLYLEQGFDNSDIPWTLITSAMKNIMDNNKDYQGKEYSYGGIKYCLWYMKEIEEVNMFDEMSNTILGLVPFYYDKSKKYWFQCDEIKKMVEEFEFDDKVIVVKKNTNKVNKWKEIPLDSL